MPNELILITGVTGRVGFRTLVEALNQGYRVRAVVRKIEQADQIKNVASIKPLSENLDFVVVEDLLLDGAFDNVLDGVHAVIHVAAPRAIATDEYKRDIIDPAVKATTSILKSAAKVPLIRRVVITSSMATLLTSNYVTSDDTSTIFTARDTYPPPDAAGPFDTLREAYAVSKSHALAASEQFVTKEKPDFDLVTIIPSMIIGRNELHSSTEELERSTNGMVIGPLKGSKASRPSLGASIHLDDVARVHVDALKLDPVATGTRRLLCSSGGLAGTTWEDAKDIVQQLYSKQVQEGLFPLTGTAPTRPLRFDASETEEILGWTFTGFKDQVKSVVDHYIELASKKDAEYHDNSHS